MKTAAKMVGIILLQAAIVIVTYNVGFNDGANYQEGNKQPYQKTEVICHGGDMACEQVICHGDEACLEAHAIELGAKGSFSVFTY